MRISVHTALSLFAIRFATCSYGKRGYCFAESVKSQSS